MERRINLGESEEDARYAISDSSSTGGDLRLLDVSGASPVEIARYDYDADQWVFSTVPDLAGNDLVDSAAAAAAVYDSSVEAVTEQLGTSSNRQPVFADTIDTEQVDTTNETFVRATRGSATSSTSSGTWVNIVDGESKDVRGEFNESGNARFVPDRDGEYEFTILADVRGNTSGGDILRFRILNVDSGGDASQRAKQQAADSNESGHISFVAELSAGTAYEPQVANQSSSFTVSSGHSEVVINRVIGG